MPIHLLWGDDYASSVKEIENIIQTHIDPAWSSFNISRLDGSDANQSFRALDEIKSAPLGNGGRVVLVKRSLFCNGCSIELAKKLEQSINLIPEKTHLILYNSNKPDRRLKTTKLIQNNIKSIPLSSEKSFVLPLPWDIHGQRNLIQNIANELNLKINNEIITLLVESLGSDSALIYTELEKLSLLAEAREETINTEEAKEITIEIVNSLIQSHSTNAIEISNHIIQGKTLIALEKINYLLENGEPALRLVSTLTGQVRGWLWVKLLDSKGNQDVNEIAKLAGILNPKRIFVIRKQIQGKSSGIFLEFMKKLLKIEASIKSGVKPIDAFKDNLLTQSKK